MGPIASLASESDPPRVPVVSPLWDAPGELRTLKLRLLAALFTLAQRRSTDRIRKEICDDLFVLAEDWDSSLLSPIVRRAEELCKE